MLGAMRTVGRENVLSTPVALPRRALAGSVGGKALEALTLVGLVLLVPRALGPLDYGGFAVALAVSTAISTATGIGGAALFARVLGPLAAPRRGELARVVVRRLGAVRGAVVAAVAAAAAIGAAIAPGTVSALHVTLVLCAVVLGSAATLLSQLALGLERTTAWSLRYPLENGVIVCAALVLYPVAGLDGAIAAIALGAAAALGLGLGTVGRTMLGGPPTSRTTLPAGLLRFARLQTAGGVLTQAVHRGAAPACALLGVGGAATGHAAIAAGGALAITYAVMQTTIVALPGAVRASASGSQRAEAPLRRVAALAAIVVVPGCAVLALLAEPLLAAGLGDGFRDAATPLRIALGAAALAPLWALSTQLATLRNQPEAMLAGAGAGAATFAVVAAVALPEGGASAAAAAMLAGVAATTTATFAALRRRRAAP